MATPVLETISDAEAKWDKADAFVDERLKKSSSADDFLPLEPETTRNELWGWYLFAWAVSLVDLLLLIQLDLFLRHV
jgi:hypothetical protein